MNNSFLIIFTLSFFSSCSNLEHFGKIQQKRIKIAEGESVVSLDEEILHNNFGIGNDFKEKKAAGTIWNVTDDEYVLNYVASKPGCFEESDIDDREIITVLKEDFETAKLIFLGKSASVSANGHEIFLFNREVEYIWCTIGPPIMTHNYYYSFREARRKNAKVN